MQNMNELFTPFHDVLSHVARTITGFAEARQRPVMGVMPAYFPMELIEAAGGYPVQLWGNNLALGRSDAYLQAFCCSVGRSMLELELMGGASMVKAYAFTSICDTLINLRELYRRIFSKQTLELSIPMTRTNEARRAYLKSVLETVMRGLEEITGTKITPERLAEASALNARTRALQRELYRLRRERPGFVSNYDFYAAIKTGFFLPRNEYNQRLERLLARLEALNGPSGPGVKIVLSGMVFDPIAAYRLFDELGLWIVDDDFANGWRTVSKARLDTGDLVQGVTDFLFNPAPCCCLYNPDNDRHPYLLAKVHEADADGVLFWYTKFCEPDAFDRPQLMERLRAEGIPAGLIEVELSMTQFDALRTRLDAFREMIEG
jgi:bcr-type benzoyl-CoA reductase subunit C